MPPQECGNVIICEKIPKSPVHDPTGKHLMMKVKQLRLYEVLLHHDSVQNTALKEKSRIGNKERLLWQLERSNLHNSALLDESAQSSEKQMPRMSQDIRFIR